MISYSLLILNALGPLFLCAAELYIFSANYTNTINREQKLWTAGKNFDDNVTEDFLRILTSTANPDKGEKFSFTKPKERGIIPLFFDARDQWPYCKTIRRVPDQGSCANCWAAAMAVTLSSRLCVQSRGKHDYDISMDDITRCCSAWNPECGLHKHGCYGGHPNYAYKYWLAVGAVSGGYHGSNEGCRPYSDELFNFFTRYPTIKDGSPFGSPSKKIHCIKLCSNVHHKKTYRKSLMSGFNVNYLYYQDPINIQLEIMNNGPVQAHMLVYKDFSTYQHGVYFRRQKTSEKPAWHVVMILGWGEEHGVKYWLVCNTWGTRWGKLGGYFKIKRGKNECEIESRVYGPWYGFGQRATNKTVKIKTDKASSSTAIRVEKVVIVVNFVVLVTTHFAYN